VSDLFIVRGLKFSFNRNNVDILASTSRSAIRDKEYRLENFIHYARVQGYETHLSERWFISTTTKEGVIIYCLCPSEGTQPSLIYDIIPEIIRLRDLSEDNLVFQ